MRPTRPVLAAAALGILVPLALPAGAATTPSAGAASSTINVASLTIGSIAGLPAHSVAIGTVSQAASNVGSVLAAVSFTAATVDGKAYGKINVDPASSPKAAPVIDTAAYVPAALVKATSPAANIVANSSPLAKVTGNLGSLSVLGIPLTTDGAIDIGSSVTATSARAGKTVTISQLSLPTLKDLLAALGLDISKLPLDVLEQLGNKVVKALDNAVTVAYEAAQTAQDAIDDAQSALGDVTSVADDAQTVFDAADAAFDDALGAIPMTRSAWDATPSAAQALILAVNAPLAAASTALAAADTALATANAAVDVAQAALDAALAALVPLVSDLVDAVLKAIDVPLVSIDSAKVGTIAEVVGNKKVAKVTGTISGVKVLGKDLIADLTGSSTLDVAKLVGDVASQINGAVHGALTMVSSTLDGVAAATGISLPVPSVKFLTKSEKTGTDGAFGTASAAVSALDVSLGSLKLPRALALPAALTGALPGVALLPASGEVASAPLSLSVGTITEAARFRPAVLTPGAPGSNPAPNSPSGSPSLPTTGAPAALALFALVATAAAVYTKRMGARSEA